MNTRLLLLALGGCALLGCSGAASAPKTIAVNGRVVDYTGQPISGAKVLIIGNPVMTTDEDGGFSVGSVEVPYDLAIADAHDAQLHLYLGVTGPAPVLMGMPPSDRAHRTLVSARLQGASADASGARTDAAIVFAGGMATNADLRSVERPPVSMYVDWLGGDAVEGDLHAVTYVPADSGMVDHFVGYGRLDHVRLTSPKASGFVLDAAPVKTVFAEVDAVRPSGAQSLWMTCSVDFGQSVLGWVEAPSWQRDVPAGEPFRCAVPDLPFATAAISLAAEWMGGAASYVTASGVRSGLPESVEFLTPPTLLEPEDRATVSAASEFRWTQTAPVSVLYLLTERMVSPNMIESRFVLVFTAGASVVLPDLSPLGVTLRGQRSAIWSVTALRCPVEGLEQLLAGDRDWCPVSARSQPRTVTLQ